MIILGNGFCNALADSGTPRPKDGRGARQDASRIAICNNEDDDYTVPLPPSIVLPALLPSAFLRFPVISDTCINAADASRPSIDPYLDLNENPVSHRRPAEYTQRASVGLFGMEA